VRRPRVGAFRCSHGVVFEAANGCGRAAMRSVSHAKISERAHALRPLMALGSPILNDFGKWPRFSRRCRVDGWRRVSSRHSGSSTNSWVMQVTAT
jgi:hypothetical protein